MKSSFPILVVALAAAGFAAPVAQPHTIRALQARGGQQTFDFKMNIDSKRSILPLFAG